MASSPKGEGAEKTPGNNGAEERAGIAKIIDIRDVQAERNPLDLTYAQAAKQARESEHAMLIYPQCGGLQPRDAREPDMWEPHEQERKGVTWRAVLANTAIDDASCHAAYLSELETEEVARLAVEYEKTEITKHFDRKRAELDAHRQGAVIPGPTWVLGDVIALGDVETPLPDVLPCGDRPGVFYRGQRSMMSGEAAVGKTWIALFACVVEIAAGRTVVWVDLDNMSAARILERLRMLAGGAGVTDADLRERFRYVRPVTPAGEDSLAVIAGASPSLVVIDSLNPALALHGADPMSTTDVDTFLVSIVDPLTAAGACVLMLDHVPKNAANHGRYAYGSERKLTGVDVHLTVRASKPFSREEGGESWVDVAKDRDGHVGGTGDTVGAFRIEVLGKFGASASFSEVPKGIAKDLAISTTAEKIAAALGDEARPKRWIEDNVPGRAATIREALDAMQAGGHISITRGSHGSKLIKLVKSYSVTEDGPL